jgi:hypothetical protein
LSWRMRSRLCDLPSARSMNVIAPPFRDGCRG